MIDASSAPQSGRPDRTFFIVNGLVSAAALAFLTWLLVLRSPSPGGVDLSFMPAVNASLNATSALCLCLAFLAIKRGGVARHRMLVTTAFVTSSLFLVGYIVYHSAHGDTHYPAGPLRPAYYVLLASHVLLSIPVVPLCLTAFYFALTRQFARHKTVARWTLPIWLYVSVTGVLVFVMLRAAGAS